VAEMLIVEIWMLLESSLPSYCLAIFDTSPFLYRGRGWISDYYIVVFHVVVYCTITIDRSVIGHEESWTEFNKCASYLDPWTVSKQAQKMAQNAKFLSQLYLPIWAIP
jgi:hypothetical protein